MQERTSSILALRAQLAAYYREGGPLRRTLERLTGVTFDERLKDVLSPNNWGQYDDTVVTTIYYCTVNVSNQNTQCTVDLWIKKRWEEDGKAHRFIKSYGVFHQSAHYGVGVPCM